MAKKQFKAESKKLLDMMINSIYTHKDIFLRELISNASDALDKLYYHSLSGETYGLTRDDYKINLEIDKESRTLTISDNGCGMTKEELENNLGVIARSGSLNFKKEMQEKNTPTITVGGLGSEYVNSIHQLKSGQYVYVVPYAQENFKPTGYLSFEKLAEK